MTALARRTTDRPRLAPGPALKPADFATLARQSLFRAIQDNAKAMVRDRGRMAIVDAGLPDAEPADAILLAINAYRRAMAAPQRWFGFGGETPTMNARSAWVAARWERRFGGKS